MAIELTPDELIWLRASLRGKTPMITKVVAGSLVAKGLMTSAVGGPVLNDADHCAQCARAGPSS